jgi:hypothetical protein
MIRSVVISGGQLQVTGQGGYPPNSTYNWLSTTSLMPPITWITNSTGTLDGAGGFSNSIPINPSAPAGFYRLQLP